MGLSIEPDHTLASHELICRFAEALKNDNFLLAWQLRVEITEHACKIAGVPMYAVTANNEERVARAEHKQKAIALELHETQRRLARAESALATTRTRRDGVWLWQDGGDNDLDSLSCPVVMSADTYRELVDTETAYHTLQTAVQRVLTTSARLSIPSEGCEQLRQALDTARDVRRVGP